MTENSATSRVWSIPVPSPPCSARRSATRRLNSTISTIAGMRLATSSRAISGGFSVEPGSPPRNRVKLVASMAIRTVAATSSDTR